MPDDNATGGPPTTPRQRLAALFNLKDFAVSKGYDVPTETITEINKLHTATANFDGMTLGDTEANELDRLTAALTQYTLPVTILNVDRVKDQTRPQSFVYLLLSFGLLMAILSGYYALAEAAADASCPCTLWSLGRVGVPLYLGMLGAVIYVLLPNGRLNTVVGLDAENKTDTIVRVIVGGLLGYVLYLAGKSVWGANANPTSPGEEPTKWLALLPLIGGYSITLVVGILSKAVAAIQLTFNIDDKSVRSSLHK